jgi:hypothetical protein
VDQRRLETRRFSMIFNGDVPQGQRERVARGLRYLGVETLVQQGAELTPIDLRGVAGGAPDALARAVAWGRHELGVVTGADR